MRSCRPGARRPRKTIAWDGSQFESFSLFEAHFSNRVGGHAGGSASRHNGDAGAGRVHLPPRGGGCGQPLAPDENCKERKLLRPSWQESVGRRLGCVSGSPCRGRGRIGEAAAAGRNTLRRRPGPAAAPWRLATRHRSRDRSQVLAADRHHQAVCAQSVGRQVFGRQVFGRQIIARSIRVRLVPTAHRRERQSAPRACCG